MVLSINPVIIIFLVFLDGCFGNGESHVLCFEREKQALLSFKKDLVDPYQRLKSWDVAEEEDCCKWARVVCNNITGHVSELHLNNSVLTGKINPSLLNLIYLTHLDLSFNHFDDYIPKFMGSLVSLSYLSLTSGGFMGMIPHHLGNLSSLHHLDLGTSSDNLYVENLHWLSGLSLLEHLDMTFVDLSKASDHWLLAMNTLPSLKELHLSSCKLRRVDFPSHVNLTSLEIIDLSANPFDNPIPSAIENLTSIVSLDFSSFTLLEEKIPTTIGNLCNLKAINLEDNDFSGEISNAFKSLSGCLSNTLQSLYIDVFSNCFSGHCFTGQIPDEIGEFKNLVYLSLSGHKIYGPIPMSIGKLSALKILDISSNQLNGPLPESLGSLSNLKELYLCYNQLTGSLPKGFGYLSNLEVLEIYSNHLEGHVSEVHFANLRNLREIIAYGNQLNLSVSPHWIPPFHLNRIELGSWILGPQFPMWLKSQKNFSSLDLSNTRISDVVPNWFWNLSTHGLIDLSRNQIYGEILFLPAAVYSFREIYLYSNNFMGPIPHISSGIEVLDISNNFLSGNISHFFCDPMGDVNNLHVFDLKDNFLSGEIPKYCWEYWQFLGVIHLDNNKLTGEIPSSMGHSQWLQSLHLRNNNLIGKIPDSLQNHLHLSGLDLGLNDFVGTVPKWIGNLSSLQFLGLRSNKLIGPIPIELCKLVNLQILDIADNMLSGTIPRCFGNLTTIMTPPQFGPHGYTHYHGARAIENAVLVIKGRESQIETVFDLVTYLDLSSNILSGEIPKELTDLQGLQSLNLSRNNLKGSIPDTIGNMIWVESLDLSRNQLFGKIPLSISSLSFLNHLNLSYNNLSGKIPIGTQLQSFDAFSFIGNQLCGPPLTHDCGESERTTHGGVEIEDGESETKEEEEYWFRLGITMGFVVSFLGIIGPLLFSRIWRRAYFWFFQEYLWYKILDCFINFKYMLQN